MKHTLLDMPLYLTTRIRQAIQAKFNPHNASETRQLWDLWYMPEQYCYLIANADRIIPRDLIEEFRSERDTRLAPLDLPQFNTRCSEQIHVYVNGCFQGLHNDSSRPGYSYVYYLQDEKTFTGGQTLLFAKPFPNESQPAAGSAFYEQIEPTCGRMVLFNNNVPHMVPVVQGTMNPNKGRITLCSRLLV